MASGTSPAEGEADGGPSPSAQFLRVRFEVPRPAAAGEGGGESGGNQDQGETPTPSVAITEQSFDAPHCKIAVMGLPEGVEPAKPEPGDYGYSGMHDHGPLPPPKEGGTFARLVGLVTEAKKASDAYLTDVIAKEKALKNVTSNGEGGDGPRQKRRRK